ncbi:MAG: hypothetical protein D3M94_20720 [Rhodocyclales bacterium GT-UBC]|nr:MAG: hypothetical protein D3M94_20720 [Rhodocyclales bacterium GT-UBC]
MVVGSGVAVGAGVVVGSGVAVGAGVVVGSGVAVGAGVVVGSGVAVGVTSAADRSVVVDELAVVEYWKSSGVRVSTTRTNSTKVCPSLPLAVAVPAAGSSSNVSRSSPAESALLIFSKPWRLLATALSVASGLKLPPTSASSLALSP